MMFDHGLPHPNGGRFFGYVKDHPKLAIWAGRLGIEALLGHFGAATAAPKSSLATYRCPIFAQGPTGSCIGHGASQLTATALGAAGKPSFVPSPLHNYCNARIEALGPNDPLSDVGAMPADLESAIANYGVRDMMKTPGISAAGLSPDGRFSDVWADNVNVRPSFQDDEEGVLNVLVGEYQINFSTVDIMIAQMQAVIDVVKRPIGLPWFVDSGVMSYQAGDPPISSINTNDSAGGGHWTSCDEYFTDGSGNVVFGIPNSWGEEYGNKGVVYVMGKALIPALLQPPIAWTVRS